MKKLARKIPLLRALARRTRGLRSRWRGRFTRLRSRLSATTAAMGAGRRSPLGAGGEERRATDDFALSRVEWRDQGATPYLVDRARAMAQNTVAWRVLSPAMWAVYAGVLIEAGDRAAAEQLLRTYLSRGLPVEVLTRCLPVAQFAGELRLGGDEVARAAQVAEVLQRNSERRLFAQLVAGRTVAVVGNGPGNLGSGKGAEIDAHDVVIRFNNHPTGYEADYGIRTDIWVRGAHRDVRDRVAVDTGALVVWEMDFFRNLLEVPAHADILYRDVLFSPDRVTHIDTETKAALRRRSGLLLPTSGAQILWMLFQSRGSLAGVDVYGFSSITGGDTGHYFDALGDMGSRHDVEHEGAFLRSLLVDHIVERREHYPSPAMPRSEALTIFGCAYREYDPATGKTGGPGGVLATQRLALGDHDAGADLAYLFQGPEASQIRERLAPTTRGLSTKIAQIVEASEYIRTHPDVLAARERGDVLMVCHELGTAYGAYRLGIPYVLVYHQQGSTLQEMRSIGRTPSAHEISVAGALEKLICDNAQTVFFPSLGARDTYLATSESGVDGGNFADWALYNTVSAVDHDDDAGARAALREELIRELDLPPRDEHTDVFLSVGDFNEDKGLDRIPALLSRHARLSGRTVVWIAIGASSDRSRFEDLERQRESWPFTARLIGTRTTHDRLLALMDLADYYVMMHRNAIFDLATLEAMRAGKALILSPVGGNLEVDLASNVLFVDEGTILDACRVLETRDRVMWGERNRAVYEEHFSLARFTERYRRMIDEQRRALDLAAPRREARATAKEDVS
ncbi:glycosyltransferase family 29 protein [Microbacterium sp. T2.11-28]|uniref:glycosyltransferase family 29 protein n=1 Tax=Microbacterium sp. T2.11-28 TaxID=3041169 RepID=UPI002477B8AF|nr:glycosyltransferase family 29 protein [Microbacterium sp. T2.11-28]CAI9392795.1 hypothetical protein MICABA_02229 [Microbacterium sp. T2.11-28]